jgi:hypothetical protein
VVAGSLWQGVEMIKEKFSFLLTSYLQARRKESSLAFIFPLDRVFKELYNYIDKHERGI